MHTGPMKRAGGMRGRELHADHRRQLRPHQLRYRSRSSAREASTRRSSRSARAHGAIVIGDIIPGHTGKGADFRLAERAYGDYPGLYHMVGIEPDDWTLLPAVPAGRDAVNLSPADGRCAAGQGLHRRPAVIA